MEAALTAIRALHIAALVVLFGEFAYAACVMPGERLRPRFLVVAAWSLAIAVLSALAWLAAEAGHMSGEPVASALRDGTVATVLTRTLFGHAWLVRAGLAAVLVVALAALRTRPDEPRRLAFAVAALCSALLLASLACVGHAAGESGTAGAAHLCADGVHLLAAGAWLGALLPLVALLRDPRAGDLPRIALAVHRFSLLGMACVGALALTGFANATFALAHVSQLFDSSYGEKLLAKLALFALIVSLAAVNRFRLTPRLASGEAAPAHTARRKLLRNAIGEAALGFAIVAIVGNLGITMPPMHGH